MSKHTLSRADVLYAGASYYPRYNDGSADRADTGLPVSLPIRHDFGAPLAIDTNALVAAATSTELPNATTATYTTATSGTSPLDDAGLPSTATIVDATGVSRSVWVLDVPRNVTLAVTHNSSIVAITLLVSGFDQYGEAMSELFSITATGTSKSAAGKKAFKYILSYTFTSAGNATADTANVGFADVLGLPYRIDRKDRVVPFADGALDASATIVVADDTATATTTTGDVRGTIDFATASDAAKFFSAILYPGSTARGDRTLAFGVVQA